MKWFKVNWIILLILSGLLLVVCSKREKAGNAKVNIVRIATDATFPPFESVNSETGGLEGFDIDLIKEICKINGWTPMFIITSFEGIISNLNNKKCDIIISAMTITPERTALVSFSESYFLTGQTIAVPLDDSLTKRIDDLTGMRVGVQEGTTGELMAKNSEGLQVYSYENIEEAFIDMADGNLDAVLNDYPSSQAYILENRTAKMVGKILSSEHYGIAVRKYDKQLLDDINKALKQIRENNRYLEFHVKWFNAPPVIKAALN